MVVADKHRSIQLGKVGHDLLDTLESTKDGTLDLRSIAEDTGRKLDAGLRNALRILRRQGYVYVVKPYRPIAGGYAVWGLTPSGRERLALEKRRGREPGVAAHQVGKDNWGAL